VPTVRAERKETRLQPSATEPTADTAVTVRVARPPALEPTVRTRAMVNAAVVAAMVPTAQRTVAEASARATVTV
jgi:hypothetical protein